MDNNREILEALERVVAKLRVDGRKFSQRHKIDTGRTNEMERLRQEGWTLQRIGDKYGISRERVRQLIGNTGRIHGIHKHHREES